MVQRRLPILLLIALTALPGCHSGPWLPFAASGEAATAARDAGTPSARAGSDLAPPEVPAVQQAASFSDPSAFTSTTAGSPAGTAASGENGVLQELEAIGAVDPAAAQQLVERLQGVKPSLRPLVAQQFRTSWEYHRQLTGQSGESEGATTGDRGTGFVVPQVRPAPTTPARPLPDAAVPATTPEDSQPATDAPPTTQLAPHEPTTVDASAPPAEKAATPPDSGGHTEAANVDDQVTPANHAESPTLLPTTDEMAAAEPMVESPRDWQVALEETIRQLGGASTDDPHNTEEAYDLVRLRMLHLLAGDRQQALEPIPGLTPTEQGYWSNQLFALATLLDYDAEPDDERRASVAGEHLAEASARLGELSMLRVNNVTFCKKVYGFGDYEALESKEFSPGQRVTLYAEMENFRSESTEDGYHTSLATSYQVLDPGGHQVESGEFATVDDYCVGKRKDFYIEYTFQLPIRMYANEYELQLMIRDRLSGKIGKATVDFKITE